MKSVTDFLNAIVRPLVTILFVGALTYGFIVGTISGDTFIALGSAVVGFWFSKREQEKVAK
jgi:hypothetical protein